MTLISTILEPSGMVTAISDVILPHDSKNIELSENWPLNTGKIFSNKIVFAAHAQKTIIINQKMYLQWAGSAFIARIMIQRLRGDLKKFRKNPELWCKKNLCDLKLNESQFNICWINGDNLHCYFINCQRDDTRRGSEIKGGSGSFFLADNGIVDIDDVADVTKGSVSDGFQDTIKSLARCLVAELTYEDLWSFRFGGWYELVVRNAKGFEKVPYVVVVWKVSNQGFAPINLVGSRYKKGWLLIDRILPQESRYDACFCIGAYGNKYDLPPASTSMNIGSLRWPLQFHLFLSEDSRGIFVIIRRLEKEDFNVEVTASKIKYGFKQSFADEVIARAQSVLGVEFEGPAP